MLLLWWRSFLSVVICLLFFLLSFLCPCSTEIAYRNQKLQTFIIHTHTHAFFVFSFNCVSHVIISWIEIGMLLFFYMNSISIIWLLHLQSMAMNIFVFFFLSSLQSQNCDGVKCDWDMSYYWTADWINLDNKQRNLNFIVIWQSYYISSLTHTSFHPLKKNHFPMKSLFK